MNTRRPWFYCFSTGDSDSCINLLRILFAESNLPTVCYLHTTLLLPVLYNKLNSDSIKNVCVMRRLIWKTPNIYLPSTSTSFLQCRCFPRDPCFRECPGKWGFSYVELSVECMDRRTEPLGPNLFSFWNLDARIHSSLRDWKARSFRIFPLTYVHNQFIHSFN